MNVFAGINIIEARPMTRLEYNQYRKWGMPFYEDGSDKGYLIEYMGAGNSNHMLHENYITWSPEVVFNNEYKSSGYMSFGQALAAMELGFSVYQSDWPEDKRIFMPKQGELPYIYVCEESENHVNIWSMGQKDILAKTWGIRTDEYPDNVTSNGE